MKGVEVFSPPNGARYVIAPISRRFGAWLLDMALVSVAAFALSLAAGGGRTFQTGTSGGLFLDSSTWLPLLFLVSVVYAIPMWSLRGATLGQRALDLNVYRAERPTRLPWSRAAIRWTGPFGWLLFAVASLQDGLWVNVMLLALLVVAVSVGRDRQHRFLHDRLSASLVVQNVPVGA